MTRPGGGRKSPAPTRAEGSARHDAVAADVDPTDVEAAVRLFHGSDHRERRARLERTFIADLVAHDRHIRTDDDLLLTVLVFDGDDRPRDPGDRGADRTVGHGA